MVGIGLLRMRLEQLCASVAIMRKRFIIRGFRILAMASREEPMVLIIVLSTQFGPCGLFKGERGSGGALWGKKLRYQDSA